MTFCFELNRNEIHPKVSWGKFWMAAGMNNAECSWVGPHLVTKTIVFPRLVSSVEKGRTTKQERSHLKGKSQLKTLKQNKNLCLPLQKLMKTGPQICKQLESHSKTLSKTNVLWGKEELFLLWESLSILVASELFVFSGTFCCLWFTFCSFLVSCVSFTGTVCKYLALSQWIIFDVGEMSTLGCVHVYIALQKGSSSHHKPAFFPKMGCSTDLQPSPQADLDQALFNGPKRQNSEFSLTQVPICLSITAVTIYLLGLNLTATQCSNFLHVPLDVLLYYCLQSAEARFCICGKACWEMSPLWPHLF